MINKNLAIYLHIPFCVKKCGYCDFLSAPAKVSVQESYVEALCREIESYSPEQLQAGADRKEVFNRPVTSIFFGGGTPSLLQPEEILRIMDVLKTKFWIASDAENTIECNPGTVTEEKLEAYRQAGLNRLSLGLQSADNGELKKLGRVHTWEQFLESWNLARGQGFDNINIDLMSALPGQTLESYQNTLKEVLELSPEHISAYSLIIEEGTPFYSRYHSGKGLPSEEEERLMYQETERMLKEKGYARYEISNYALPKRECRHNLSYWTGGDYIGFGIGASSCLSALRYKNVENLQFYLENSSQPRKLWREIQALSPQDQMEEFMFLGLRCMKGVSVQEFARRFGCSYESVYGEISRKFMNMGLLYRYGDRVALTNSGIDVSNVVLAEFLL